VKTLFKAKGSVANAVVPVSGDQRTGQTIATNPLERQAEAIKNTAPQATRQRIENLKYRQPFQIRPFINPRTGTRSWRVDGSKRDGIRVRENFADLNAAQCRQTELTTEWLLRHTETAIRATKLTEVQVKLAEAAFLRLDSDQELNLAVEHWLRHAKQYAVAESPRLDDAIEQFSTWLCGAKNTTGIGSCTLREITRQGLRTRVAVFGNSIGNLRVDLITAEIVEGFLAKLKMSAVSRDNYKRAVSRFFSWCIERPRRWTAVNPCREIKIDKGERPSPTILTLKQCEDLLRAAEREGIVPYIAVCLFGGLRPFEAARLTWEAVNLVDREIRLEGIQTKTGRPRIVTICNTLRRWLKAYQGQPFFPSHWRSAFDAVKEAAGFGTPTADTELTPWTPDVMRHTAASHFFRLSGSYGRTAEEFGNSEAIIKEHYVGRVSSQDTKHFYALLPSK
jgi:integrase